MGDGLVSVSSLAKLVGVRPDTLSAWARSGRIPSVPYGKQRRYEPDAVARAIAEADVPRTSKTCTACGVEKPLDRFQTVTLPAKKQGWSDWTGPSADCRDCRADRKRQQRRSEGRPSRAEWAAQKAEQRIANEATRAAGRAMREAERAARPRLTPAQMIRRKVERQRARYNNDPGYQARIKARKIKRKRALRGTQVEPINRDRVAERDGWRCGICRRVVTRSNWSLDHVHPLSKGGSHTYENVVLAHLRCNVQRGVGRLPVQPALFPLPPHPVPKGTW